MLILLCQVQHSGWSLNGNNIVCACMYIHVCMYTNVWCVYVRACMHTSCLRVLRFIFSMYVRACNVSYEMRVFSSPSVAAWCTTMISYHHQPKRKKTVQPPCVYSRQKSTQLHYDVGLVHKVPGETSSGYGSHEHEAYSCSTVSSNINSIKSITVTLAGDVNKVRCVRLKKGF